MAKYDAQCCKCDNQFEFQARIEFYNDPPECPLCGGETRRIILAAPQGFVKGKFESFLSPVDGTVINNARELAEHNKRNSVVNIQEGYSEEKVLRGDFGAPEKENTAEDISKDVGEALRDLNNGYKPIVKGADDEL